MSRARALFAAAVIAAAAGCASATGAGPGGEETAAAQGDRLYVAVQSGAAIAVIDVDGREIARRIDLQALGFGPNAKPHDIAVEPDGSYWYVSLIGENRVLKLDRDDSIVGGAEMEVPGLLVTHPTEDLLLVGRSMTAVNPPASVAIIRRSDMTLLEELEVVFPRPHALAIRPAGDRAYSASLAENRMAVIDPSAGEVALADLPAPAGAPPDTAHVMDHAGHTPHTVVEFAVSPDGRTMVAGAELSGLLLVFDLADPDAPRLIHTVELGGNPWHPVFTPDGAEVWIPLHAANAVAVIDVATWRVVDSVQGDGIAQPHAAIVSRDGRTVFVSNQNTSGDYGSRSGEAKVGTVVVIDATTRQIVRVLEVGPQATGMDILPGGPGR